MKKLRLAVLLGISLVVGSVESKSKYTFQITTHDSADGVDSTFGAFLKRFSDDSLFQMSRIQFPLRKSFVGVYYSDTTYLAKEKWTTVALSRMGNYKRLEAARKPGAQYPPQTWVRRTVVRGAEVKIVTNVVDTGISVIYVFRRVGSHWMLVSVEDVSN